MAAGKASTTTKSTTRQQKEKKEASTRNGNSNSSNGGTPQEEIDRQHQQAWQLIQSGSAPNTPRFREEISLQYKERPLSELLEEQKAVNGESRLEEEVEQIPCWSSRGHIDPSALQALFSKGHDVVFDRKVLFTESGKRRIFQTSDVVSQSDFWDPIHAAVNNVAVQRPSHDAWGIGKVVLIFCDDYMQSIYHLPWWHGRQDIRTAVQPLLHVLQISEDRIVRLLLASLPPSTTIPVHHDSGVWVKRTHRIHVPILVHDASKIVFQSGLTVDGLDRIDCTPGHVFEINNQAKHAVSNCDGTHHRVHLILDYVDASDELPPPVLLQPGEVLTQTRRSVDRFQDRGSRPAPSFLILGAQKAGTTSLYTYLCQHALIVPPKRRETHCLDWRWKECHGNVQQQLQHCRQFYHWPELALHPSCLTGDSTPSYLLDTKRVIPRLQRVFDWPLQFFVLLRDPIRRAESHYAMVTSTVGTPAQLATRGTEWRSKSIQQVIEEDLHDMDEAGLIPYFDLETKTMDPAKFDEFYNSPEEEKAWDKYLSKIPLHTGSYSILGRGLYQLQLRRWFAHFDRDAFLVLSLERAFATPARVQETMQAAFTHLGLPPHELVDPTPSNAREYESLLEKETRSMLQRFFAPHHAKLATLLGWHEGHAMRPDWM